MGYIKQVDKKYPKKTDVRNLVRYISQKEKCPSKWYGTVNIEKGKKIFTDPDYIAKQILACQPEEVKGRRVYQIVYSYGDEDYPTYEIAYKTGMKFCRLYNDYPAIFTIHEDKDHLHLHLIISNFPFGNGKKLSYKINLPLMKDIADKILRNS